MLLGDALVAGRRGGARRHRRRRHPHRPPPARPRRQGRRRPGLRRPGRRPSCAPVTRAGEQHWPMPIPEEMKERIKASKVADLLQHDWVRWGGGLMAVGVPARVHRRPALGAPRHRRQGDQPRRPLRPRPRRAPPASASPRSWSSPGRSPRAEPRARLPGPGPLRSRRPSCACCSRASAAGRRPPRRRTTAPGGCWRSRAPTSRSGTRRRVHSPSWATSSSVTSLTAVRGSTKPSTPRRVVTKLLRWRDVLAVGGAHTVSSRCGRRHAPERLVRARMRRNRSNSPMATLCLDGPHRARGSPSAGPHRPGVDRLTKSARMGEPDARGQCESDVWRES